MECQSLLKEGGGAKAKVVMAQAVAKRKVKRAPRARGENGPPVMELPRTIMAKAIEERLADRKTAAIAQKHAAKRNSLLENARKDTSALQYLPKVQAKSSVALGIMMPHAAQELRYADAYTSVATLTGRPYSITEVDFTVPPPVAGALLPAGNWAGFVSRNPLAATVEYAVTTPPAWAFPYFVFETGGVVIPPLSRGHFRRVQGSAHFQPMLPLYSDVQLLNTTTTAALHGGRIYSGAHNTRTGFFISATTLQPAYIQINVITNHGGAIINQGANVALFSLEGQEWRALATGVAPFSQARVFTTPAPTVYSGNAIVYTILETGWYALEYEGENQTSNAIVDLEVVYGYLFNHSQWDIKPMAGYVNHEQITRGLRTLGVSAMLSPYANKLFRGGRTAGRQLESGFPWWLASHTVDEMGQLENSTEMSYDKGIYGYLKPDCDRAFGYQTPNNFPSRPTAALSMAELIATRSPIFPPGGWLQLAAEVPLGETSETTYPNGRAHFTCCYAIEYATADTWFTSKPPNATARDFSEAVASIRDAQQFFENPNHARDILAFLKRTAGATWRIAPAFLAAMKTINPSLAEVAHALTSLHAAASSTNWLPRSNGW